MLLKLSAITNVLLIVFLFESSISAQPVKIIFDTDMKSYVDDVGTLAMWHGLADLSESGNLGTMLSFESR